MDRSPFILSLCSGIGGLDLGVRLALGGARTVAYVEREAFAAAVLAARMAEGGLDTAPVWSDLATFPADRFSGLVDGIIGGYPCQPFSVAGRRRGVDDPRHLWPRIVPIIAATEPRFVFFENVGAHLRHGFREVRSDLEDLYYRVAVGLFAAAEAGAPHRRERLFILGVREGGAEGTNAGGADVGHPDGGGRDGRPRHAGRGALGRDPVEWAGASGDGDAVADAPRGDGLWPAPGQSGHAAFGNESVEHAVRLGLQGGREQLSVDGRRVLPLFPPGPADAGPWAAILRERPDLAPAVEPGVCRVADGPAGWVDRPVAIYRVARLRAVGNAVVPAQAARAFVHLAGELGWWWGQ